MNTTLLGSQDQLKQLERLSLILRSSQTYLAGIYERTLRLPCCSQPPILDYCEWSKAKENNAMAEESSQSELAPEVSQSKLTNSLSDCMLPCSRLFLKLINVHGVLLKRKLWYSGRKKRRGEGQRELPSEATFLTNLFEFPVIHVRNDIWGQGVQFRDKTSWRHLKCLPRKSAHLIKLVVVKMPKTRETQLRDVMRWLLVQLSDLSQWCGNARF